MMIDRLYLYKFLIELNPLKIHLHYKYNTQKIIIVCEGIVDFRNALTKLKKKCILHSIKADILTDKERNVLMEISNLIHGVMSC